jgi:outer membrane protein assembly factor BamB
LKAPFQLRWAVRSFGLFHQPLSATQRDVIAVSLSGLVVCLEQETGRLRWRVQFPRQRYDGHGVYCENGRTYLARPQPGRGQRDGAVLCLDEATGKTLWSATCGLNGSGLCKVPPVLMGGRVAFATIQGDTPQTVVQAWDADTGKPAWQVELNIQSNRNLRPPCGCALGDVMFFSGGGMTDNDPKDRYPGETVAIDAKTGKVLWRTREAFTTAYAALMARDDRLYVVAYAGPMTCLSTKDGSVLWKAAGDYHYWQHGAALGADFLAVKGYGGHATRYRLKDGKAENIQLGGTEHTCSSVVLTESGLALVATVGGLYVRDVKTGELLWRSEMGFAPRNCTNPAVTNGRVYINPQVNGMLYCFEPKPKE